MALFRNAEIHEIADSLEMQVHDEIQKQVVELFLTTIFWVLQTKMFNFRGFAKRHTISIYTIWDFPNWWKNNGEPMAKSLITKEGDMVVLLALKPWMEDEQINWEEVRKTALHEAFHLVQMEWIYRHGGAKRLNKSLITFSQKGYWANPLEKGAYAFENDPENYTQNFAEAFEI